ncbi:MAG TPA: hypothetical protein VFO62_05710 [Candidatus Binatia bacterium]|nr:hypothetical protein [Candidatus Binatia bacterium]
MTVLRALAITTAFASLAAAASAQDVGPRVAAVADLLGCSAADRTHLVNGEVVACRSKGRRSRESAAVIVTASPAATMRAMQRADLNHADRRVLASEELPSGEVDASAFAALPIETSGVMDAWNLSVTEQALLRDVAREEGGRGLEEAIRHILAERTGAYRSGGPRAIASHTRPGSGVFAAGTESEAMWARFAKLEALAPGVHAALQAYPRSSPLSPRHSFHASVIEHDGHPTVVLFHRAEFSADDYAITIEREFFVSRGYGTRQTVFGATGITDGRSIAFYFTVAAGYALDGQVAPPEEHPTEVDVFFSQLRDHGARAD